MGMDEQVGRETMPKGCPQFRNWAEKERSWQRLRGLTG